MLNLRCRRIETAGFWRRSPSIALLAALLAVGAARAAAAEADGAPPADAQPDSASGQRIAGPTQPNRLRAIATENSAAGSLDGSTSGDPDADPSQLLSLYAPNSTAASAKTMDDIDFALGQRQIFTDLRTLEDRINGSQRPVLNVEGRRSSQSDHLDISQAELSQDLYFSEGRTQLRLGLQALDYDPRVGTGVRQYVAGVTGNQRINDIAALTGEVWLNRLRADGNTDVKATYDAFLTLKPTDSIRVDLDTSRRLFDNITSLKLGLTMTSYGGSVDFTPMDRMRLTLRGNYSSYSDGNRRGTEEVEGVWRIASRPIVEIGVRGTNFDFSKLLDDGYFNPSRYYSGEGLFRLQAAVSEKFMVELAASAGAEHANPGGTKPLVKASLQLAYRFSPRWSLDGELSHFSSRQSTSSGFSRTSATIGLHYRF